MLLSDFCFFFLKPWNIFTHSLLPAINIAHTIGPVFLIAINTFVFCYCVRQTFVCVSDFNCNMMYFVIVFNSILSVLPIASAELIAEKRVRYLLCKS